MRSYFMTLCLVARMSRPLGRVGYLPRSIVVLPALLRERDAPDTAGKMPALRTSLSLYFANLNKSSVAPAKQGPVRFGFKFSPPPADKRCGEVCVHAAATRPIHFIGKIPFQHMNFSHAPRSWAGK